MEKSRFYEKAYGCLLASAIGNALGHPMEGRSWQQIEEKLGRVTDIMNPDDVSAEDDNQAGLFICTAYKEKGGRISPEDLAKVWLRDMNPLNFFFCMKNSYELLKQGIPPRLTGILNIVTGSTVMCIAPVGIYNAADPDSAYMDAVDVSYMYQRGLDVDVAALMAVGVAEAMRPGASVDSVLKAIMDRAPKEPFVTFNERSPNNIYDTLQKALDIASKYDDVFAVRAPLYENCLQWDAIDPLEVLTLTLAIFKVANGNTEQAIIGAANTGRDADTLPNLNGALCGALNGISSVPERWINSLNPKDVAIFQAAAQGITDVALAKARRMSEIGPAVLTMG